MYDPKDAGRELDKCMLECARLSELNEEMAEALKNALSYIGALYQRANGSAITPSNIVASEIRATLKKLESK